MGTEAYFRAGMVTYNLCESLEDPTLLKDTFLSLLAVPGSLIHNVNDKKKRHYYVCDATVDGIVVWNVSSFNDQGKMRVEFTPPPGMNKWGFLGGKPWKLLFFFI